MEDKKYIVITSLFADRISGQVSEKMNDGYIPYGDLIVFLEKSGSSDYKYIQAMIKNEKQLL